MKKENPGGFHQYKMQWHYFLGSKQIFTTGFIFDTEVIKMPNSEHLPKILQGNTSETEVGESYFVLKMRKMVP